MNENFHIIQYYYKLYSKYIFNIYSHIENCVDNNIIAICDRNNYLKIINKLIKLLNDEYNSNIKQIKNTSKYYNYFLYDLYQLINICYDNIINKNIHIPFKNIHQELCFLTKNIGFKTINDGMMLLCGEKYSLIYPQHILNKLEELNMIFLQRYIFIIAIRLMVLTKFVS